MPLARSRYLFALAALPVLACAAPTAGDEDLGASSEALCKSTPCPSPILPRPLPPIGPVSFDHTVTITSDDFSTELVVLLAGSRLSVDTTESAPPAFGAETTYPNPVYVQCGNDRNACTQDNPPGTLRKECLDGVNERCAGVPSSIRTQESVFSYLMFSPQAKANHAKDVLFPLTTMHHSGVFSFDIDVNYIHADFGWNVHSGFANGGVWLQLDGITSNKPTIRLSGDYPNFDFSNMSASVTLSNLVVTPDGQTLDYGTVGSNFDFDWNADNFPDFFVSALVDVTQITKDRVTKRINNGFDKDTTHAALGSAFAALLDHAVKAQDPGGYAKLTGVSVSGTSLVVTYEPK